MAKSPKTPRRTLRELVTVALHDVDQLTTAKLHKKVTELSGKKYSPTAMYNTLGHLAKEKLVSVRQVGHEKIYRLTKTVEMDVSALEKSVVRGADRILPTPSPTTGPSHKLAMGEIAIVHADDKSVVSATNVHGGLVLKRHKVPPT
jgi:hypothetical protein